jgi:hypothetical protein
MFPFMTFISWRYNDILSLAEAETDVSHSIPLLLAFRVHARELSNFADIHK